MTEEEKREYNHNYWMAHKDDEEFQRERKKYRRKYYLANRERFLEYQHDYIKRHSNSQTQS